MSVFLEEPDRYIGQNYWNRLAYEPGKPIRHVHSCPCCYTHAVCYGECTLEPDLEQDDGTPSGAHFPCSVTCARELNEWLYEAYGDDAPKELPYVPPEQIALPFEPLYPSWGMSTEDADDALLRPRETQVMALLEQLIHHAEEAQKFIQDDSRITGESDREEIRDRMVHIRSLTLEIEHLLFDRPRRGV